MDLKTTGSKENTTWNIVIVGESKSGKTTSLQNLDEKTTLILDIDNGLASLNHKKFTYWDATSGASASDKIESINEFIKYIRTDDAKKKFQTIVFDSLTEMGETALAALEDHPDFSGRSKTQPRYGELGRVSIKLIKSLRDMPHYNKIYIALTDKELDSDGNLKKGVSYPGKTSQKIPGYMDIVLHLETKTDDKGNTTRAFLTENTGQVMAGDRSKKLDQYEKADINHVIKKINS